MPSELVSEIVNRLGSTDPRERDRAADEATDVHRGLDDLDIQALVEALVNARVRESDDRAQEAQLHALAELVEWHDVPPEHTAPLLLLEVTTGDPSQLEYLALLRGGLDE